MSRYHQFLKAKPVDVTNFTCERLSSNNRNKGLINSFSSERNSSFTAYLKFNSYREDSNNKKAVYLIKDGEKLVGYFSLHCGLMVKCHKKILSGISSKIKNGKIEYYIDKDVIDVTNIVPSIEIIHFCINTSYKKKKSNWSVINGMDKYSIGQYIYYKFILPIIIDAANNIGLQMIYLFCADDGSGKLIEYYRKLGFSLMDNMACIRTGYDSSLSCMTCKIIDAKKRLNYFIDENKIEDIKKYLLENKEISCKKAKDDLFLIDPQPIFDYLVKNGIAEWNNNSKKKIIIK